MSALIGNLATLQGQRKWQPRRASFFNCGIAGFVFAMLLSHLLILGLGWSPWVQLVCDLTAVAGLLGTALVCKIFTGEDRFVFYRDAIKALVLVAIVLRLLHQPVLPYLDVTILGAGVFHAFGRVGCTLVGCCHGRPSHFGICYSEIQAQTGFPSYLVGVRLFPIQMVEAIFVFAIIFVGSSKLLSTPARAPGSVVTFHVVAYAAVRFCLEFFRGDVARPYYGGFSQAQWISLVLSGAIVHAERIGVLPACRWHAAVPLLISAAMIFALYRRRFSKESLFELAQPKHVRELADFLARQSVGFDRSESPGQVSSARVLVSTTSAGLNLSLGDFSLSDRRVPVVTLSRPARPLTRRQADGVATILSHLNGARCGHEIRCGSTGIFHVLFLSAAE